MLKSDGPVCGGVDTESLLAPGKPTRSASTGGTTILKSREAEALALVATVWLSAKFHLDSANSAPGWKTADNAASGQTQHLSSRMERGIGPS
jgi:hypothetical protein